MASARLDTVSEWRHREFATAHFTRSAMASTSHQFVGAEDFRPKQTFCRCPTSGKKKARAVPLADLVALALTGLHEPANVQQHKAPLPKSYLSPRTHCLLPLPPRPGTAQQRLRPERLFRDLHVPHIYPACASIRSLPQLACRHE